MTTDYTPQLRALMQSAGFSSFTALAQASGITAAQLRRLRRGEVQPLRLSALLRLSQALGRSLPELLALFAAELPADRLANPLEGSSAALRQEYARLERQLEQQQQANWAQFQHMTLQTLEPLLLQLPTAAHAAMQTPELPAAKLLPLLRPLDRLLAEWHISALAAVGEEVPYDPQQHQLLEGTAAVGDPVRVRYVGYRQGDRLLYRARVSPVGTR